MEIIVNKKKHGMLKQLDSLAYLDYLDLREEITKKDEENTPYIKADFMNMAECVVKMYGNKFTVDELLASVPPSTIMLRFASFDADVASDVNTKMETMKENFTKRK